MPDSVLSRREWLGLIARAPTARLSALWSEDAPSFAWLRKPEAGSIMVQGRAGSVGAAFNLGEVTVTRASVRLACGTIGHAMVQGRDPLKAERAALLDALMQTENGDRLQQAVLAPLQAAEAEESRARARRAAATKVDFFTMVRGEG